MCKSKGILVSDVENWMDRIFLSNVEILYIQLSTWCSTVLHFQLVMFKEIFLIKNFFCDEIVLSFPELPTKILIEKETACFDRKYS